MWFNLLNRNARTEFAKHPLALDSVQQKVATELKRHGICVLTVEELVKDDKALDRFRKETERLLNKPNIKKQIQRGVSDFGGKGYVVRAFGENPRVDLANEFLSFALSDRVLGIVNGYLEMFSRLETFDVWYNLPVSESASETASQKWHRDYDDQKLVKLFVYLNDVNEQMGPFSYIRETHHGGKYREVFPQQPPQGSYPPRNALEKAIPSTQLTTCTGHAGTLIFCDTTGFHKGGRSTTDPRILFTATYVTDGSVERQSFRLSETNRYEHLSPAAKYAVRYPSRPNGMQIPREIRDRIKH